MKAMALSPGVYIGQKWLPLQRCAAHSWESSRSRQGARRLSLGPLLSWAMENLGLVFLTSSSSSCWGGFLHGSFWSASLEDCFSLICCGFAAGGCRSFLRCKLEISSCFGRSVLRFRRQNPFCLHLATVRPKWQTSRQEAHLLGRF